MTVRIIPSILSADFAHLADEIARIEAGGADGVHVDVMDGRFVPNISYGTKVIETVRRLTDLPLDVHCMIVEPERHLETFARAGASGLTIHAEASPHLHRQLHLIKALGCAAGVALNPATSLECVRDVAADLDLLLIMSVDPGYGGQVFIPNTLDKTRRARALLQSVGSQAAVEVDGGINRDTIHDAWRAGADTFVAGYAVFAAPDPCTEIAALRARCAEVV